VELHTGFPEYRTRHAEIPADFGLRNGDGLGRTSQWGPDSTSDAPTYRQYNHGDAQLCHVPL